MELWIRSQDKEILVKVNNLSLVLSNKDETCEIINSFEDYQCWELGTYKTKERALEILDDIESLLCGNTTDKGLVKGIGIRSEKAQNLFYEMPKE